MLLTPDDIMAETISGYKHVWKTNARGITGHGGGLPFQALLEAGPPRKYGPRRATARESAWDYCNWRNENPLAPKEPRLKRAGHNGNRPVESIPSDIEAAYGMIRDFKAQQAGKPGYVYLIVEDDGLMAYGKIGYSTNPRARVRELQTGNPRVLRLYATKLGSLEDERALHDRHLRENVLQEWFRITPSLLAEWDDSQIIKEVTP